MSCSKNNYKTKKNKRINITKGVGATLMLEINKIYNEDCLEGMKKIDDKSIDMICTDRKSVV